jgi:hypothetical protein
MTALLIARAQLESLKTLFEAEGATGSAHYLGTVHALAELDKAGQVHCATCQCAKLPSQDERHVPSNNRSRSWHRNAPNGPPK